jgi:hypothetical protein
MDVPIMGATKFMRFFRTAAGLDVDKTDLKRYNDFVNQTLYDLFVVAKGAAKANGRDIIEPPDLPITKGLQESMRKFNRLDERLELEPLLEQLAARPPLDVSIAEETQMRLPAVAGGLSLALAHAFQIIDPDIKNPQTQQWEVAFQIFDLLL